MPLNGLVHGRAQVRGGGLGEGVEGFGGHVYSLIPRNEHVEGPPTAVLLQRVSICDLGTPSLLAVLFLTQNTC